MNRVTNQSQPFIDAIARQHALDVEQHSARLSIGAQRDRAMGHELPMCHAEHDSVVGTVGRRRDQIQSVFGARLISADPRIMHIDGQPIGAQLGNDIDDTTSPLEAGLGWITKLKKPAVFNGQDWMTKQKEASLTKKLVGFTMQERRVPRHEYLIMDENDTEIGVVTSGTQAPSLDIPIGMGYVPTSHAAIGSKVYIQVGKKNLEATVCNIPFLP